MRLYLKGDLVEWIRGYHLKQHLPAWGPQALSLVTQILENLLSHYSSFQSGHLEVQVQCSKLQYSSVAFGVELLLVPV